MNKNMLHELKHEQYSEMLRQIITEIKNTRVTIARKVNTSMMQMYWNIGKRLADEQLEKGYGSSVVKRLAEDLQQEFPDTTGFSRRNVYAILQWHKFYSVRYEFVPHRVAQIPWGHNLLIINKIKDVDAAEFYVAETAKNAWDRDTLEFQIENKYHLKIGNSVHNFAETLPAKQSELAAQTLKDPYNFDFLGLENDALEKAIEDELTKNVTKFLLELGRGFAFLGRQYKIEIGDADHFLDMLFYHVDLRCYIVIELKAGKFQPEYAGKLNYYLSAVDSQLRKDGDNSTIGILLCKMKNKIDVEYALRDINKPIGISKYRLTDAIPDDFKPKLPSVKELEEKLRNQQ
jgi:predicted nuclease of restriction endonuclease-like (RecB) superfamily